MKILLTAFILLFATTSYGQVQHFFIVTVAPYSNFFNKEKERIQLKDAIINFGGSYKIQKGKFGIEAFFNEPPKYYNHYAFRYYERDSMLLEIVSYNFGISLQYSILESKYINVSPMVGIVYNFYSAYRNDFWVSGLPFPHVHASYDEETNTGILLGLNVNAPIYRSIYASTNLRQSFFPSAQINKANFVWEFGLGYRLQRKHKK